MVDECASCEAGDELLFTCSYCDEQFCATHQFPHHACKGFGRAGQAGDHADAAEWLPASSLGDGAEAWSPETTADAGDREHPDHEEAERASADGEVGDADDGGAGDDRPTQPVTVTTPEPSARAESLTADTWGGSGGVAVSGSEGVVNVRPMDSRHVVGGTEANAAPRTVGDWITRQTYLTLMVKVGIVAFLINAAFYGGMAVTLYGLFPFVL